MASDTKDFEETDIDIKDSFVTEEIEGLGVLLTEGDTLVSGPDIISFSEEHLTNQIWINGRKVYRRVIDFGALPSSGNKVVRIDGLTTTILSQLVRAQYFTIQGTTTGSDIFEGSHYFDTASADYIEWKFEIDSTPGSSIVCDTGNADYSTYDGKIILEYTRTDR